jgi:hypothetical protein
MQAPIRSVVLLLRGERSFCDGRRDEVRVAAGRGGEPIRDDRNSYVLLGQVDEMTLEAH